MQPTSHAFPANARAELGNPTLQRALGLARTGFPARMPASAVTRTFGRASSILVARLAAAKPPNTTECMAPMRTVASIAITASGIIGM